MKKLFLMILIVGLSTACFAPKDDPVVQMREPVIESDPAVEKALRFLVEEGETEIAVKETEAGDGVWIITVETADEEYVLEVGEEVEIFSISEPQVSEDEVENPDDTDDSMLMRCLEDGGVPAPKCPGKSYEIDKKSVCCLPVIKADPCIEAGGEWVDECAGEEISVSEQDNKKETDIEQICCEVGVPDFCENDGQCSQMMIPEADCAAEIVCLEGTCAAICYTDGECDGSCECYLDSCIEILG